MTTPDKCPKCSSDTPRTDNVNGNGQWRSGRDLVGAEFARLLERELTAEKARANSGRESFLAANANAERLAQEANRERTRADAQRDRAEKWKVMAKALYDWSMSIQDWSPVCGEMDEVTDNFEALMKEEQ